LKRQDILQRDTVLSGIYVFVFRRTQLFAALGCVGKVFLVHAMKVCGEWSTAPFILRLSTRRRWVIKFTFPATSPPSELPIDEEAGWTPETGRAFCRRENYLFPTGIWIPNHQFLGLDTIPRLPPSSR